MEKDDAEDLPFHLTVAADDSPPPPAPGGSGGGTKKGANLRVEVRHGGLGLAQQRLQVYLVDGVHEGE